MGGRRNHEMCQNHKRNEHCKYESKTGYPSSELKCLPIVISESKLLLSISPTAFKKIKRYVSRIHNDTESRTCKYHEPLHSATPWWKSSQIKIDMQITYLKWPKRRLHKLCNLQLDFLMQLLFTNICLVWETC